MRGHFLASELRHSPPMLPRSEANVRVVGERSRLRAAFAPTLRLALTSYGVQRPGLCTNPRAQASGRQLGWHRAKRGGQPRAAGRTPGKSATWQTDSAGRRRTNGFSHSRVDCGVVQRPPQAHHRPAAAPSGAPKRVRQAPASQSGNRRQREAAMLRIQRMIRQERLPLPSLTTGLNTLFAWRNLIADTRVALPEIPPACLSAPRAVKVKKCGLAKRCGDRQRRGAVGEREHRGLCRWGPLFLVSE
jgi:hypothetical protein